MVAGLSEELFAPLFEAYSVIKPQEVLQLPDVTMGALRVDGTEGKVIQGNRKGLCEDIPESTDYDEK